MSNIRTQKLKQKFAKLARVKKPILRDAFEFFRAITPRKTGAARRNTRLTNKGIEARYAYAEVLDAGRRMTRQGMRGSDQAPEGMTKPTIKKFREWVKKHIKLGL